MFINLLITAFVILLAYTILYYVIKGKFTSYSMTFDEKQPWWFIGFMGAECSLIATLHYMLSFPPGTEPTLKLWMIGAFVLFAVGVFSCKGSKVVSTWHMIGATVGLGALILSPWVDYGSPLLSIGGIAITVLTYIKFRKSEYVITYTEMGALASLMLGLGGLALLIL